MLPNSAGGVRKTVLVVEDDPLQLETLTRVITLYNAEIEVSSAPCGSVALHMVDEFKIDALVCDLAMPDMDGFELLKRMQAMNARTPVLIVTSALADFGEMAKTLGAAACFDEPLDLDAFLRELDGILAKTALSPLYGVSITGILQLVAGEKQTCMLTILSETRKGRLYFQEGRLFHAEARPLSGEPAVCDMLKWTLCQFHISKLVGPKPCTIQDSLTNILLRAAIQSDHETATQEVA